MKDPTTTPTAELLAEWEIYHSQVVDISQDGSNGHEWAEACCVTIAKELDRRCSEAGIETVVGLPVFTKFEDCEIPQPEKDYLPHLESATLSITIRDLRDLLTWLLMKGGAND